MDYLIAGSREQGICYWPFCFNLHIKPLLVFIKKWPILSAGYREQAVVGSLRIDACVNKAKIDRATRIRETRENV